MSRTVTDEWVKGALQEALLHDGTIQFKRVGNDLRDGVCPQCGKKELFVSFENPWRVQCRRANNCGYSESTRALYPEIFEALSKTFEASPAEPNAAADAYLRLNRGFDVLKLRGMYSQETRRLHDGGYAATVRFPLPLCGATAYWERLIDVDAVRRNDGRKAHISTGCKYAGKGWIPEGLEITGDGQRVWLTEGIFHAIALLHAGRAAVAGLSCSNLPREIVAEHGGKGVVWVVALDADTAGVEAAVKWRKKIIEMGERVMVAIPEAGEDWDDVWRAHRLGAAYLAESFYRGWVEVVCEKPRAKAGLLWLHDRQWHRVFDHGKALWKYKVDEKRIDQVDDDGGLGDGVRWDDAEMVTKALKDLAGMLKVERISNCLPSFIYIQRDEDTSEQWYTFRIEHMPHTRKPMEVRPITGDTMDSPSAFNKALMNHAAGATFDGDAKDLRALRDMWLNRRINYVRLLTYVGYDPATKVYVYPSCGYHAGKRIEVNADDYLVAGDVQIKTGLHMPIEVTPGFDGAWIGDFMAAFHWNGLVLLSWWLGTLFAEQIRAEQESWPFLEYTGDQGAGKTTQLEFLWRCCGRSQHEGTDPSSSTRAGLYRAFEQCSNLPLVLLEGDRNGPGGDQAKRKTIFDFDELKKLYNGGEIRSTGVKTGGSETRAPKFRGGMLISQNAEVDGSEALLSRIVHCHCTRAHFTAATGEAARRLNRLEVGELSGFLDHVLRMEPRLVPEYLATYEAVLRRMTAAAEDVQNRILKNHAQVAAWGWMLPAVFGEKAVTTETCGRLEEYLLARARNRQTRIGADHPTVARFWEIVEYIEARKADAGGGSVCNHASTPGEIAVSLTHVQEMSRDLNMEVLPQLELKRLLPGSRRHRFVAQKKVYSRIFGKPVHCWVFEGGEA